MYYPIQLSELIHAFKHCSKNISYCICEKQPATLSSELSFYSSDLVCMIFTLFCLLELSKIFQYNKITFLLSSLHKIILIWGNSILPLKNNEDTKSLFSDALTNAIQLHIKVL